jgi:predicted Zn finger-like uncharacterized protein
MQLITRCPQCQTAFAFEAEKMRMAQGWVRCGRCSKLFEADQHLYEREAALVSRRAQTQTLPKPQSLASDPPTSTVQPGHTIGAFLKERDQGIQIMKSLSAEMDLLKSARVPNAEQQQQRKHQ